MQTTGKFIFDFFDWQCLDSRAKCKVGSMFTEKCPNGTVPAEALNCPESEDKLKTIDKAKLKEM